MLINQKTPTPPAATRPLVGAALLAFALAGCGGGTDNADPAAPSGGADAGGISVKTNTGGSHDGAEGAPAEGSGQDGAGSTSGSEGGGAKPATGTAAISARGISTELFEQIISTQTAYVRFGRHAFPMSASYAAEQLVGWNYSIQKPDLNAWASPDDARIPLTSYQYVGTRTHEFVVKTGPFGKAGKNANQEKQLESLTHLSVTFPEGAEARDRRLTFGTAGKLEYGKRDGADYDHTETLTASAEKVIPLDGIIPFDEKIQEWHGTDESGNTGGSVNLTVEKGDKDDEVMLCLSTYSHPNPNPQGPTDTRSELQRKTCSEWQVPADWTSAQRLNYRGIFVEESNMTADIQNPEVNEYYRTKPVAAGRDAEGASGVEGNTRDSVTQAITQAPEAAKTAATEVEQQAEGGLPVNTASGAAQIAAEQAAAAGEDTTVQPATGGDAAKPAAPAPGGGDAKPAEPAPGGDAAKPAEPAPGGDAAKPAEPAPGGDAAKPAEPAPAPGGGATAPVEPTPAPTPAPAPAGGDATPPGDTAGPDANAPQAPVAPAPAAPGGNTGKPDADAPAAEAPAGDDAPGSAAANGQASNSNTSANDDPPDNDPIAALTR